MTNEELFQKLAEVRIALANAVELVNQWQAERAAWAKKDLAVKELITAAENYEKSLSGADLDLLNAAIAQVEGK